MNPFPLAGEIGAAWHMMFQKRIQRAFHKLHEDKMEAMKEEKEKPENRPELEKHDLLAMVIAALLVIGPVALAVMGVLAFVGYLFFFH